MTTFRGETLNLGTPWSIAVSMTMLNALCKIGLSAT